MSDTHVPYDDEDEESSPEEMEGLSSIGIAFISMGVILCALIAYFLIF